MYCRPFVDQKTGAGNWFWSLQGPGTWILVPAIAFQVPGPRVSPSKGPQGPGTWNYIHSKAEKVVPYIRLGRRISFFSLILTLQKGTLFGYYVNKN